MIREVQSAYRELNINLTSSNILNIGMLIYLKNLHGNIFIDNGKKLIKVIQRLK